MKPPSTRTLDLQNSVGVLLTFLTNRLTATGSATYRARFGLGVLDVRLLIMLAAEPDISPRRICQVMGLDNGAVSRALRALEERGLVKSRPDARNSAYRLWSLTARGVELQNDAVLVSLTRDSILLHDFTADERATLVTMLQRMLAQVDSLRELVNADDQSTGGARRPRKS